MAARENSSVKPQKISHGFVRALGSAALEWLLIFLLFIDAIFSYLITRFAHYCELQRPCLLCSRLDHVLGNEKLNPYRDLICGKHRLEISSLVLCHAHNKLVDVRGMCQNCLFSFATVNRSITETYRLLVGKVGDDSNFGSDEDPLPEGHKNSQSSIRHCSCCNEPWTARGNVQKMIHSKSSVSEPAEVNVHLSDVDEHNQHFEKRIEKPSVVLRATHPKSYGQDPLSHVEYTELKVASDTESEVLLSDDDAACAQIREINCPKEDLAAQYVQLEPHVIIPSHDSAQENLIDHVSASEPSLTASQVNSDVVELHSGISVASTTAVGDVLEDLNWEHVDIKADPSAVTNLISLDDVPPSPKAEKASIDISHESKLISVDDISTSSSAGTNYADVSKENMLIHLDIPQSSKSRESPLGISKESKLISFDEVSLPSNAVESSVNVSEQNKLISVHNASPSAIAERASIDVSNDSMRISVDDVSPSSNSGNISMDVSKENQLIYHDVPPQSKSIESSIDVSQESKFIAIDEVSLPSNAVESSVDVSECKLVSHNDAPPSYGGDSHPEVSKDSRCNFLDDGLQTSDAMESPSEAQKESCATRSVELKETEREEIREAGSVPSTSNGTATERNPVSSDTAALASNLLDLSDAYKVAVGSRGRQLSGVLAEQWFGRDSSRLSEDLKLLLSQLSARGFDQLLSDMSPRIRANSEELRSSDTSSSNGMKILQKRISLERNESGFESLDGSTVSEIEGESAVDRLKRQIEHDKKLLNAVYKELEEERNASTDAINQAMAMITRLQEEKASLHMEALQSLRMMEEQAEYDMETLQKTNDLLAEKEKEIQDLEEQLEYYRKKYPNDSMLESILELNPGFKAKEIRMDHSDSTCVHESENSNNNLVINSPKKDMSSEDMKTVSVKNWVLEFEDEKKYILESLKKLEKKLYMFSYNGLYSADLANGGNSGNAVDDVNDSKELNCKGDSDVHCGTEGNDSSMLNKACESKGSPHDQGCSSSLEKPQISGKDISEMDCGEKISPALCEGTDLVSLENEISDLNERLEALESDQNFLELTINSLKKGEDGVQFVQEIAYHLRELRRIGVRRSEENVV